MCKARSCATMRFRSPMSGISMIARNTAIIAAGIVSTYFQFASQSTCMKNNTTSIAFVQETAIMKAQPTCGSSRHGQNDE